MLVGTEGINTLILISLYLHCRALTVILKEGRNGGKRKEGSNSAKGDNGGQEGQQERLEHNE